MSAPFKVFRVFTTAWTNLDHFIVEVQPYVDDNHVGHKIERDTQRRFIEDAIREKLERAKETA